MCGVCCLLVRAVGKLEVNTFQFVVKPQFDILKWMLFMAFPSYWNLTLHLHSHTHSMYTDTTHSMYTDTTHSMYTDTTSRVYVLCVCTVPYRTRNMLCIETVAAVNCISR